MKIYEVLEKHQGRELKLKIKGTVNKMGDLPSILGMSTQNINYHLRKEQVDIEFYTLVKNKLKISVSDIENNIENNKPKLEAKPLHLASGPNDQNTDGRKFEDLGDGILRMQIPIIPIKAQAGYLIGYPDPEYYEGFKTIPVDVYKEHFGHYLAFEVNGDSMMTTDPELFEYMALPGWKAVGREVPRQHWKYRLHTHKVDTWIIVHKKKGILLKQIIKHNVEEAEITIHSLNPLYNDDVIKLNDVAQIFSVVKYIIDK